MMLLLRSAFPVILSMEYDDGQRRSGKPQPDGARSLIYSAHIIERLPRILPLGLPFVLRLKGAVADHQGNS
jgi:hypothetical protein